MKLLLLVLVTVVGIVDRATAWGDQGRGPQGQPEVSREMIEMAATMADRNRNGFIDRNEAKQPGETSSDGYNAMLAMGDANSDGKLSKAEYVDVVMMMSGAYSGGLSGGPASSFSGASSMKVAFSLLSLLALALRLF